MQNLQVGEASDIDSGNSNLDKPTPPGSDDEQENDDDQETGNDASPDSSSSSSSTGDAATPRGSDDEANWYADGLLLKSRKRDTHLIARLGARLV